MSTKAFLRCLLLSLLIAIPAPVIFALIVLAGNESLVTLNAPQGILAADGVLFTYIKAIIAMFLVIAIATLLLQQTSPALAGIAQEESDDRETGTVKWFNVSKGFGFITRDEGDDVFVHFRSIRGNGHRSLAEGQRVRFSVVKSEKGLQAEDVTVVS